MSRNEILTEDKKESADVSDSVGIEEIKNDAESVKQELEKFSQLLAEENLSKEKFLEVAGNLQKEMGQLNLKINMMRRKYARQ